MKVKTIEVLFRKVKNLGDYNSEAAEARLSYELDDDDQANFDEQTVQGLLMQLEAEARTSVRRQLGIPQPPAPRAPEPAPEDDGWLPENIPDVGPFVPPAVAEALRDPAVQAAVTAEVGRQVGDVRRPAPADLATAAQVRLIYMIGQESRGWMDSTTDNVADERYQSRDGVRGLTKKEASAYITYLRSAEGR